MSGIEPVIGAIALVSTVSNAINIVNKSHSFVKWVEKKKEKLYEDSKEKYETWQWIDEIDKEYVILEKKN
jgi:hypothetical protein